VTQRAVRTMVKLRKPWQREGQPVRPKCQLGTVTRNKLAGIVVIEMKRDDTAGVWVPPPVIFVGAFALGVMLDKLSPLGWPWLPHRLAAVTAIGLAAFSAAIICWQVATFRQAGTPVAPRLPTMALVTTGPYRFSRNPDYGAQALLYLALTLALGRWWSTLTLIPAMLAIRHGVISREERYLERRFGEQYRAYKRRVRRWI